MKELKIKKTKEKGKTVVIKNTIHKRCYIILCIIYEETLHMIPVTRIYKIQL